MKLSLTLSLFSLLGFTITLSAQIEGYEYRSIAGYDVYIQQEAWDSNETLTSNAIGLLTDNLTEINALGLRSDIVTALQEVQIFVDWDTNENGAAVYHPSEAWLLANGYIPEKAKSVELGNVQNFYNCVNQNQPFMVLHELAHAYHDRVLGFGYAPINEAYTNGLANDLYGEVSYHVGYGVYIERLAYASTNAIEYFAELSEAYLGENDFYPFDREDLAEYDTLGYQVVADVWQFEVSSTQELLAGDVQVFPNPSSGPVQVTWVDAQPVKTLRLYDATGQRLLIKAIEHAARQEDLDLSHLPAGIYYLGLDQREAIPIIKIE